ncbi:MAG: bile acid:sodium symporter [Alphaproteobacteria bacterium]|nr:bile acid:sodium symporter [Alphaproteobacteria bacterium]
MIKIENRIRLILHITHRYFIWMLVLSYAVAAAWPDFGSWIRSVKFGDRILPSQLVATLPVLMLAVLLFNAGLGAKTEELTRLLQKPFLLGGALCCNVLTPLVFIVAVSFMVYVWHNQEEVQQILMGLALVASMPIAGASTAWSQNSNGNLALSLGLVLSTTALSPLLTPFVLHIVGFVTTGDYSEDLHELAFNGVTTFLGLWVILPTLLGVLVRLFAGDGQVTRVSPYLKLINFCLLLILNYSNASLTLPDVLAHLDSDFLAILLLIVCALCGVAFSSGYVLAKVSRASEGEAVSLVFGLGMNNNGTGLVLASVELADHPQALLPIIFYNLMQHLVASIVDRVLFKSGPPGAPLAVSRAGCETVGTGFSHKSRSKL